MGIEALEKKVASTPALAHMPLLFINGRYITPLEAIGYWHSGLYRDQIEAELKRLKIDPDWENLALEYYKRLRGQSPNLKIVTMSGKVMTVDEIIEHIKAGDLIGAELVDEYRRALEGMVR